MTASIMSFKEGLEEKKTPFFGQIGTPKERPSSQLPEPIFPPSADAFTCTFYSQEGNKQLAIAQDNVHKIACQFTLFIENVSPFSLESAPQNRYINRVIVGKDFVFNTQACDPLITMDRGLYESVLERFKLKILEELLVVCAQEYAGTLFIELPEEHANNLLIYRNFASEEIYEPSYPPVLKILCETNDYDEVLERIEKWGQELRHLLWEAQKNNPIIQKYLKHYPLSDF